MSKSSEAIGTLEAGKVPFRNEHDQLIKLRPARLCFPIKSLGILTASWLPNSVDPANGPTWVLQLFNLRWYIKGNHLHNERETGHYQRQEQIVVSQDRIYYAHPFRTITSRSCWSTASMNVPRQYLGIEFFGALHRLRTPSAGLISLASLTYLMLLT